MTWETRKLADLNFFTDRWSYDFVWAFQRKVITEERERQERIITYYLNTWFFLRSCQYNLGSDRYKIIDETSKPTFGLQPFLSILNVMRDSELKKAVIFFFQILFIKIQNILKLCNRYSFVRNPVGSIVKHEGFLHIKFP